jgi:TrmH family RNA methyltransferase
MIASLSNPTLRLVRALQRKRLEREREGAFVIEGVRLFEEAARANVTPRVILHTGDLDPRSRAALAALSRHGAEVHPVTAAVMAVASDTETPSGLLAVVPITSSFILPPSALTFAIVCDRLADPGNLGTILRTAEAAGVQAVFLAPGTVDAHNPKVVRAAMGAHFHLPIVEASWNEIRARLNGLAAWLADAAEGERYDRVDWRAPCALIVGSEAEGPSEAARAFAPHRVHIPMPGRAESLNAAVAAGVLLFEIARQRNPAVD